MIDISDLEIDEALRARLKSTAATVKELRESEPLDSASLAKLEEHFRALHIYHSAGIEGNRLSLQETLVVLQEGIDISGKPLKDVIEVRLLSEGFDYLSTLAKQSMAVRETDLRDLHKLVIGSESGYDPGKYRTRGVLITGSEHTPPEPLEVPARMVKLVEWINKNNDEDSVLVASVAHHELAAIHPFMDGNGRVSRLLMNLLLMRGGYPISNIRREDRPTYYEALAFADVGIYDPIITLAADRIDDLLREYQRLIGETRRTREWAEKWKGKELDVQRRREQREYELWFTRMRQVRLEFEKAADLLNDNLTEIEVEFFDYRKDIDFDSYQQLRSTGRMELANAFSIKLFHRRTKQKERIMFRYFRNWDKFDSKEGFIPLEVNYLVESKAYKNLTDLPGFEKIRLRELFFDDDGRLVTIQFDPASRTEKRTTEYTLEATVRTFLDDLLRQLMGLE